MSLAPELIQSPQREFGASPASVSRWNSAHLPIIFKFQRSDFTVQTVESAAGSPEAILVQLGEAPLAEIQVGDEVYINSGVYVGIFTVIYVDGLMGELILDTPYLDVDTIGGWVNLAELKNWRLQIRILEYSTGEPIELTDNTIFHPDSTGLVTADLHQYIKKLISFIPDLAYDQVNVGDYGFGGAFNIQWKVLYTGGTGDFIELSDDNKHFFVNGVKQLQALYGNNFAEFVPDQDSGEEAKFLTAFEKPVFWPGYPWSISFIYPDNLQASPVLELIKLETYRDKNGNYISSSTEGILETESELLNHLMLEMTGYDEDVRTIDISLLTDDVLYVDTDFVDEDYVEAIEEISLTETLPVEVDHDCKDNAVYLRWINRMGGLDYWLFHFSQPENLTTGSEDLSEKYIEDVEDADTKEFVVSLEAQPTRILQADNLTLQQRRGLEHLLTSPQVMMLTDNESVPAKWQTIRIKRGTFNLGESRDTRYKLEIEILDATLFLQTQ